MTPPNWRRLVYSGGELPYEEPRRILVLETLNGVTEIAFCPPDLAITHFDYDEADELARAGTKEEAAHAEVERARQRAGTILDERVATEVLSECGELARRAGDQELVERIVGVLAPATAFAPDAEESSFESYRHREQGAK